MAKKAQATAPDFFATAKPVSPKNSLPKGKKEQVEIDGLDEYAALDVAVKTIDALKDSARTALEYQSREHFYDEIERTGKPPVSFEGKDSVSEASVQLRRKASNQPLNDEVAEALTEVAVPFDVLEDKPETFIINPERLEWLQENSASLSKSLAKIGAPIDLFQKQEAVSKRVVTEETISVLCKKDRETVERLLPLVTTFAVRPTTTEDPTDALIRILVTICGAPELSKRLAEIKAELAKEAEAA